MPFSKEQNRRIYITAMVISFLLIIGSIYLHLRQKTHLGRMSFHLDRDRIQPTSGVDVTTTLLNEYEAEFIKNYDDDENDNDKSSSSQEDTDLASSGQYRNNENIKGNYVSAKRNDFDTKCLQCLCMTVNECRPTTCGSGYSCGLYRISKFYWLDAGKLRVQEADIIGQNDEEAYLSCVSDDNCSSRVIHQYFDRYKRDCNKDGLIDCKDLIALHLLGPSGCLTQNISHIHENRLNNCLHTENNLNYFYSSTEEEGEEEAEEEEDEQ